MLVLASNLHVLASGNYVGIVAAAALDDFNVIETGNAQLLRDLFNPPWMTATSEYLEV